MHPLWMKHLGFAGRPSQTPSSSAENGNGIAAATVDPEADSETERVEAVSHEDLRKLCIRLGCFRGACRRGFGE